MTSHRSVELEKLAGYDGVERDTTRHDTRREKADVGREGGLAHGRAIC